MIVPRDSDRRTDLIPEKSIVQANVSPLLVIDILLERGEKQVVLHLSPHPALFGLLPPTAGVLSKEKGLQRKSSANVEVACNPTRSIVYAFWFYFRVACRLCRCFLLVQYFYGGPATVKSQVEALGKKRVLYECNLLRIEGLHRFAVNLRCQLVCNISLSYRVRILVADYSTIKHCK